MFKLSKKIAFKEVDDQIVLINLDSGFYYSLNETAALIFNRLQTQTPSPQIIQELCNTYDLSDAKARQDMRDCIDSLVKENILVDPT